MSVRVRARGSPSQGAAGAGQPAPGAAQAALPGGAEEVVELRYRTWGGVGRYSRTVAILRDGTVLDPSELGRFAPRKGMAVKKTIKVGGEEVTVEIANESSARNEHYVVRVPARAVLAVVADALTTSGWKGFRVVRGEGEVAAEEREEKGEDEKYVYTRRIVTHYYVNAAAGVKVPLKEEVVQAFRTPKGRPAVRVAVRGEQIVVAGDTFHVRDKLKELGFKWDGLLKRWYKWVKAGTGEELRSAIEAELQRTVEALKPVADVDVEAGRR